MEWESRTVSAPNQRRAAPSPGVALDQFSSVHEHMHQRLCKELLDLQSRVDTLRASPSAHSATMISAYERMIRHKLDFMESWGMDTQCRSR